MLRAGPGQNIGRVDRTQLLDISDCAIGRKLVVLSAWDMEGRRQRSESLLPFMSERGIYIVAAPAKGEEGLAASHWLDYIQQAAPGSVVLLVLTHCDAFLAEGANNQ
eukprot:2507260-Prymnesium_polylepis.1